jgi:hypothetical protein
MSESLSIIFICLYLSKNNSEDIKKSFHEQVCNMCFGSEQQSAIFQHRESSWLPSETTSDSDKNHHLQKHKEKSEDLNFCR